MKIVRLFALWVGLAVSSQLMAENAINVAESTVPVGGLGKKEFSYKFAEGDHILFSFETTDGKELKEIEIIEEPSSMKFMGYKTKKLENKELNVPKTGVYKFIFTNSSLSERICKFKIQRIPADESTRGFNTNINLKTVYDTTYVTEDENYVIKADTSFQNFYSSTIQVSAQNVLNNTANYQVVDIALPENTASWSFYIGTGREGQSEYERVVKNFTPQAIASIAKLPGYGPLAALALTGISYFGKIQGEDNVKYWFLKTPDDVTTFKQGRSFTCYKTGNVLNEASKMSNPVNGKLYLALLNDNAIEPIVVTVKLSAVVVKKVLGTRPVRKMHLTSRQEPTDSKTKK
ncbi:MAG: hypothetical protein P4L28_04915 [Paludibacteraceae bacterium]|nr:hypothetical protein [Paludibacteraceae bacterium]